jgi:8-amino-7-oxononanoate synthase
MSHSGLANIKERSSTPKKRARKSFQNENPLKIEALHINDKENANADVDFYAREVGEPGYHGFPSESPWDEMTNLLRPRKLFMWFREIERDSGKGRVIVRDVGEMVMLSGYSYLGLNGRPEIEAACDQALSTYGSGTHGSRWLAGHTSLHAALEAKLAKHHGREDAVVFASGYIANVSTISTLLSRHDIVFSDRHNHASITDGCRFSGAELSRFRHNDVEHLDELLSRAPKTARKLVVVDGVFSMSGAVASLPEISQVCRKYGAALMVDECHSHFVLPGGGIREYFKLAPDDVTIEMGTLSKAIPSNGGYIASSADICTHLRRAARAFIYSGSSSAVMVAAALASLDIIEREGEELLSAVNQNKKVFVKELKKFRVDHAVGPSPIIPIHVGPAITAAIATAYCHQEGIFIHPVFPPVVERGQSLLRAAIMANHDPEDLKRAAKVIAKSIARAKAETLPEEAALM